MAAPDLAARNCFFVNYVGTDDAGYNRIGAPWSYRSLAAALADLASVSNPPSAANPWTIAIGPGTFIVPAFQLPAWVFITGSADSQGPTATTLKMTGDISLATNWGQNADVNGGLANLVIDVQSGSPIVDFTMPAPVAGTAIKQVFFQGVKCNLPINYQASIPSTDNLEIDQSSLLALLTITAGQFQAQGSYIQSLTMNDRDGNISVYLDATPVSAIDATQTTNFVQIVTDAIGLPFRSQISIVGTVTIYRQGDAFGLGYTPTNPANWTTVPVDVQEALDTLAAGAGPGGGSNGYGSSSSGTGNPTITASAPNYAYILTITGAAETRQIILNTAASAADRIVLQINCAVAGMTLNLRNATAGGTILDTFLSDDSPNGCYEFVFTGAAWVRLRAQIPA